MTNHHTIDTRPATDPTAPRAATLAPIENCPALDVEGLLASLLDKAAEAQLAVINARGCADRRKTDEALLRLRASTLLIASVPVQDTDTRRFAVLAAALLAAEDDDNASHARRMVEHAISLSEDDAVRRAAVGAIPI